MTDEKHYCTAQIDVPKYGIPWSFCFKEMHQNEKGEWCCDKHGKAVDNMLALHKE